MKFTAVAEMHRVGFRSLGDDSGEILIDGSSVARIVMHRRGAGSWELKEFVFRFPDGTHEELLEMKNHHVWGLFSDFVAWLDVLPNGSLIRVITDRQASLFPDALVW